MELVRRNQNQLDPVREILNEDFLWGFPFIPATGKQLAGQQQAGWFPALDVTEDKDKYVIKADLPGLKKEDVRISLEDGVLSIEGERKSESEQKDKNYHRVERSYGRFVRSINLGSSVDDSKVKANYKDGVLEITASKAERAKAKHIDISVN
jgi:HSP20 family protein